MRSLNYILKSKHGYESLCNVFLFLTLLSIIIDPSNSIFHIKNVSFVILLVIMFPYFDFTKIYMFLALFSIPLISLVFGLLFPNADIDTGYMLGTLKSFMFLLFILCMRKNSFLKVFRYFFIINFCVAIFCIVIWILIQVFPEIEPALHIYFNRNEEPTVMLTNRTFIGIPVRGVFYRTCMLSIPCLSYSIFRFLFQNDWKYSIPMIVFVLYLLFSGTRANMFAGLLIFGFLFVYRLYRKHEWTLCSLIFFLFAFASILVVAKLLTDTGEASLDIKSQHQISYLKLFSQNPLRYLLIGDGPGALFYTTGFKKFTTLTELSYYDLVRNYGLINTVIILAIFLYPVLIIYRKYSTEAFVCLSLGCVAYVFVAGTNPNFVGSNGFTALAVYIYIAYNNEILHSSRTL